MAAFDDDARRWARTALGMSAGEDARFALLRKVKAFGFNLPADVGVAYRIVGQAHGDLGGIARILESAGFGYERDQQRRQAIDAFAELFFTLPLAERAARFQALRADCGSDPLLQDRLARLGRGLEIDIDREVSNPQDARVVSIVRELFPLAAEERASRRRELVREVGRDRPFGVETLVRLRTSWRELAELDPELWRQLESAVSDRTPRRVQPVIERAPTAAPLRGPTKSSPPSGRNPWWPWILFAVLASSLARSCSSPPVREQPVFHPAFRQDDADFKKQRELVDEILKRHRERQDGDEKK